jgi:hypothetical protein
MAVALLDNTRFGDTAKTKVADLDDGAFSASGYWSGTLNEIDDILRQIIATTKEITVRWGAAAVGVRCSIMQGVQAKYDIIGQLGSLVAVKIEAATTGAVYSGLLLHPNSAETASASSTSVDNAASSSTGLVANYHALAVTGSPATATIIVDHSSDNTTFVPLTSVSVAGGATSGQLTVASGTTINRYLRARITITGGTSPSVTYSLAVART